MRETETRSEPVPAAAATPPRAKSQIREYGEAVVVAVVLALLIRAFVVQAFTIPSGSMMDTLLIGDYILVNKFLYGAEVPFTDSHLPGLRDPRRGDIIVFKYPNDESRDFIKRIVALGGETVQVRDNQVLINGKALEEPYVKPGSYAPTAGHCGYPFGCDPIVVPPGHYFVMGDNRDLSLDSRYWGFVPHEHLIGRPLFIYWSFETPPAQYTRRSLGERAAFLFHIVVRFFSNTRWERMFKLVG
jgi:signal peptidase I